jgi:chorismate mutase
MKHYLLGPCSIESLEQLTQCYNAISSLTPPVDSSVLFRAGIWKPRSKPNGFEGHGEIALSWLNDIKKPNLPVGCEVGTASQAKLALKYHMDFVWLGARTVVLPFLVDEILLVLSENQALSVWIKNPLTSEFNLWAGAVERALSKNFALVGAIHRGTTPGRKVSWRNRPLWSSCLELQKRYAHVPVVTDPSHLVGSKDELLLAATYALSLGHQGLMLETHPDPRNALSDANQQLPLHELETFLSKVWNLKSPQKKLTTLESLRLSVVEVDAELVALLAERMHIVRDILWEKKKLALDIEDTHRFQEILASRKLWWEREFSEGSTEQMDEFFKTIHALSLAWQKKEF